MPVEKYITATECKERKDAFNKRLNARLSGIVFGPIIDKMTNVLIEANTQFDTQKQNDDLVIFGCSAVKQNPDGTFTPVPIESVKGDVVELSEPVENVTITSRVMRKL